MGLRKRNPCLALTLLPIAVAYASLPLPVQLENVQNWVEPGAGADGFFPYAKCYDHLSPDHFADENRNGILPEQYRWPFGVIPFVWDASATTSDRKIITEGMDLIQSVSCLSFVERTEEINYVLIRTNDPREGCFSDGIGMRGNGKVTVNLERKGCMRPGAAAHELLHAAGFWHEQTREDRDDYIEILWDNISKKNHAQFTKCGEEREGCSDFGVPYNVWSIMHYPAYGSFPIDWGLPTMRSKNASNPIPKDLDDYTKLTSTDVDKINIMYNNCK